MKNCNFHFVLCSLSRTFAALHSFNVACATLIVMRREKIQNIMPNGRLLLILTTLVLALACVFSVARPLRFSNEQHQREQLVKERLIDIRRAQEQFLALHGRYAAQWHELIDSGFLKRGAQQIPYSDGEEFELSLSVTADASQRPLMQCAALYQQYLKGLDSTDIATATEQAVSQGQYPGLKIGDLTSDNGNSGNWE